MTEIPFHPIANLFPLLDGSDFEDLVDSVRRNGLREEIVRHEDMILDGRNRYRACLLLELRPKFREFDERVDGDPLEFVLDRNLRRRHMTESQRAMLAADLEQFRHGGDRKGDQYARVHFDRAKAAAVLNVSVRSVASAAAVRDQGAPELQAGVREGKISVSAAEAITALPKSEQAELVARGEKAVIARAKALKLEPKRQARIDRMKSSVGAAGPLPASRRFPVAYIDVPWAYEDEPMGFTDRSIENHYEPMPLADVCALPIGELLTENAVAYVWATSPNLANAFKAIEAWGLTYKSSLCWDKVDQGMGSWAYNQHELLLIAVRGDVPPPAVPARERSVHPEKKRGHSHKPDYYRDLIDRHWPGLEKVELFARNPTPSAGWTFWGDQVGEPAESLAAPLAPVASKHEAFERSPRRAVRGTTTFDMPDIPEKLRRY